MSNTATYYALAREMGATYADAQSHLRTARACTRLGECAATRALDTLADELLHGVDAELA